MKDKPTTPADGSDSGRTAGIRPLNVVAWIGDRVRMALSMDVEAIVTAITVREEGISYELTWLAGGEVHTAWLPGSAISTAYQLSKRIGFERNFGGGSR